MRIGLLSGILLACFATRPALSQTAPGSTPSPIPFEMKRVSDFRSEAVGIGDIDKDGLPDIVAGNFWYQAPGWTPREFRKLEGSVDASGKGYLWDFMEAVLDIDGDGWLDVATNSWHGRRMDWYRNPGAAGGMWTRSLVDDGSGEHECGDLWDIDGDGRALEILPHTRNTHWYEAARRSDGTTGLVRYQVSAESNNLGGGVGDINGDGRPDILRPDAWYEAPADPRKGIWKKHILAVGHIRGAVTGDQEPGGGNLWVGRNAAGSHEHTPQIWAYDVDGDGLNDVLTSSAHAYGIFWYRQVRTGGAITFRQNIIDSTFSQAHNLLLHDVDGDGDKDLVSGKRFMAHDGTDPDEYGPLGVYWYELAGRSPVAWRKHALTYNQGVGAGMNVEAADLDKDGDPDLITTGKYGGPVVFWNRKAPIPVLPRLRAIRGAAAPLLGFTGKDMRILLPGHGLRGKSASVTGRGLGGALRIVSSD